MITRVHRNKQLARTATWSCHCNVHFILCFFVVVYNTTDHLEFVAGIRMAVAHAIVYDANYSFTFPFSWLQRFSFEFYFRWIHSGIHLKTSRMVQIFYRPNQKLQYENFNLINGSFPDFPQNEILSDFEKYHSIR